METSKAYVRFICVTVCIMVMAAGTCAFSANLLVNPGFEQGVAYWSQMDGYTAEMYGWRWSTATNGSMFWNGALTSWGGGPTIRTGSYCVRVFHYGPSFGYPEGWRTSTISQIADVVADRDYTASAWVNIYLEPFQSIGSGFQAGVIAEELSIGGSVLATHQHLLTSSTSGWQQVSTSFHTSANTTQVRFTLFQHWFLNEVLNHINWDDCVLDGPPAAEAANLVVNPGFDDGSPYSGGWTEEATGYRNCMRRGENLFISNVGLTPSYYSGDEAICFILNPANPSILWYYQDISVVGGSRYTAKLKTQINMASGATSIWGDTMDAQFAGLLIKEYDASGNLTTAHQPIKSQESREWELLIDTFTVLPNTAFVRVGPYAVMTEGSADNWWWRRVTFDDVELRGQPGPSGLSGTVRSGSTPVAGAQVEVAVKNGPVLTYTTDPAGQYTADVAFGSQCTIRPSCAGYHSQTKSAVVTGPRTVDFDLVPAGSNLLFNPGFDEGAGWLSGGWKTQGPAGVDCDTSTFQYGASHCMSWPEAAFIRGPNASGWIYQDIPVLSNTAYSASVQFLAGTDPRYGSVWGSNANQVGALFIKELDASGQPLGAEQRAYANVTLENRDQWKPLVLDVTTSPSTAFIRVGGYAYIVDDYDTNLARALFDNFQLNGPPAPGLSLGQIRGMANDLPVRTLGKVVTANYDGFFYIQDPNRSSGIRVTGSAQPGDIVDIIGTTSTVGGERVVVPSGMVRKGRTQTLKSLGMNTASVLSGLSPAGLYVTLWGKVVSEGSGYFVIDDGGRRVKVYGEAQHDDYVCVTGALGVETSETGLVPVLRATGINRMNM